MMGCDEERADVSGGLNRQCARYFILYDFLYNDSCGLIQGLGLNMQLLFFLAFKY